MVLRNFLWVKYITFLSGCQAIFRTFEAVAGGDTKTVQTGRRGDSPKVRGGLNLTLHNELLNFGDLFDAFDLLIAAASDDFIEISAIGEGITLLV